MRKQLFGAYPVSVIGFGTAEFGGKRELSVERVAHPLRYLSFAKTVKADLADAEVSIRREPGSQIRRVESVEEPGVGAGESNVALAHDAVQRVAQEVARRPACDMAVGVGHLLFPKRSERAILTDSTAMPGVIFE